MKKVQDFISKLDQDLIDAVTSENIEITQYLIEKGANPIINLEKDYNNCPIIIAYKTNYRIFKLLSENVNKKEAFQKIETIQKKNKNQSRQIQSKLDLLKEYDEKIKDFYLRLQNIPSKIKQ